MIRITNDNYRTFYSEIESLLKKASFIAIDAEFSGLSSESDDDCARHSLFDSAADRYAKLKDTIKPFAAIQFGLTAFTRAKHDNEYRSDCYRFHLLPRAFPSENRIFLCQTQALEFLSSNNFDFNQLVYDGISYLTEAEEAKLVRSLEDPEPLWCTSELDTQESQNELGEGFDTVRNWLSDKSNDDAVLEISTSNFPVQYLLQKELRRSYKEIWTESRGIRTFSVIKVTSDERKNLEKIESKEGLDSDLLDYYMGFTKIMRLLKNLKKPIVGHNLLLDLMFIHKQFFRPLPKRYEAFKRSINEIFPIVYDTKFLSYEMKNVLHMKSWKSNGLAELFSYFKNDAGRHLMLNSPKIASPGTNIVSDDERFHDAGWDSYCTGYCFIRMAHIYTVKKLSKQADMRIFTNAEIMSGVRDQANRINLIRADISHLRLDDSDPPSTRPQWLRVRRIAGDTSTRQIAQAFSNYGSVNVRRHSINCFLIAVPNHGTAREILEHHAKNSEFQVTPYNSFGHVLRRINVLIWAGSAVVSGACVMAWFLHR